MADTDIAPSDGSGASAEPPKKSETQAVKKQARVFKSVIKLDKNFHIYVHGNRELIEKGYDGAMGKHYYKIYFDVEV